MNKNLLFKYLLILSFFFSPGLYADKKTDIKLEPKAKAKPKANLNYAKPSLKNLVKISSRKWIVSYSQNKSLLLFLEDNGWGGAVDGPALSLNVYDLNSKKSLKFLDLSHEHFVSEGFSRKEYIEKALSIAWKKNNKQLNIDLSKYGFSNSYSKLKDFIKPLDYKIPNLKFLYQKSSKKRGIKKAKLKKIIWKNKTIWSLKKMELDSSIAVSLSSSFSIFNKFILIFLELDNNSDCCDEAMMFILKK